MREFNNVEVPKPETSLTLLAAALAVWAFLMAFVTKPKNNKDW